MWSTGQIPSDSGVRAWAVFIRAGLHCSPGSGEGRRDARGVKWVLQGRKGNKNGGSVRNLCRSYGGLGTWGASRAEPPLVCPEVLADVTPHGNGTALGIALY